MLGSIVFSGFVKNCIMLDMIHDLLPSQLSDLNCSIMLECTG